MRCTLACCLVLLPSQTFRNVSICSVYPLQSQQQGIAPAMLREQWYKNPTRRTSIKHAYQFVLIHPTTCNIFPVVATITFRVIKWPSVIEITSKGAGANRKRVRSCIVLHVWFGLSYAWYEHGTVVGLWHVETGETLSAKHVCPVGDVAYEARCWHGCALSQSGYL